MTGGLFEEAFLTRDLLKGRPFLLLSQIDGHSAREPYASNLLKHKGLEYIVVGHQLGRKLQLSRIKSRSIIKQNKMALYLG